MVRHHLCSSIWVLYISSLFLFLTCSTCFLDQVEGQVLFEIEPAGYVKDLLIATNCILSGGGSVKPYASCIGCIQEDAQQCVTDMRFNASGTVPDGCDFYSLTAGGKPGCCADFFYQSRPETIFMETSAYPSAFTCLEDIGCQDSEIYKNLKRECLANSCPNQYACVHLMSPANQQTRPSLLLQLFSIVLTTVLLIYFGPLM